MAKQHILLQHLYTIFLSLHNTNATTVACMHALASNSCNVTANQHRRICHINCIAAADIPTISARDCICPLCNRYLPLVQPGTKKGWWNALPNWWENQSTITSSNSSNTVAISQADAAVYDQLKAQDSKAKARAAPDAWWLGTEYRGHNYALHTSTPTAATAAATIR
jgi:hypothetical protein